MKRSTIWIVSVIIGVSFLGLLLLQMRYIEQMVKMRKEQFDESVVRSLNQASRNLEQNETFRYLENFTRDNLSPSSDSLPKLYMGGIVGCRCEQRCRSCTRGRKDIFRFRIAYDSEASFHYAESVAYRA